MIDPNQNTVAIVNPTAGGGVAQKNWPETELALKSVYGSFKTFFSEKSGHAETLAREAAEDGANEIAVIGGDGTISEVVNGVQAASRPGKSDVVLSLIPSGTGGDFRKTLDFPSDLQDMLNRLRNGTTKKIDLGRITFTGPDGQPITRHFVNIASFGLSGEVDKAVNAASWPKRLGGRFTYAWCTLSAMNKYRPQKIRLLIDETVDRLVTFNTVAVCNGQYFGGGMHVAPNADPTDGTFDIIAIEPQPALEGLRKASKLYKGTHLSEPNVQHWRGQRVEALPADPSQAAWLDIDGEPLGTLPALFEILPAALNVRY